MEGVASIELEGVPPYSVWLILDSETGAFSLAAPKETSLREMWFRPKKRELSVRTTRRTHRITLRAGSTLSSFA